MAMKNSSRVSKYKEIREAIRDEAGLNQEVPMEEQPDLEEDEFLSFVNRESKNSKYEKIIDDTITEAKTFEQLTIEGNAEIDKAIKSAKSNVGKEEHHNTRLDILNRIRNPEKEVIKIDKMENINTEQFAKGYFINDSKNDTDKMLVSEQPEDVVKSEEQNATEGEKKKVTLLERLATISPKEDVEKAQKTLNQQDLQTITKIEEEKESVKQAEESPIASQEIKALKIETTKQENDGNEDNEKVLTILNYAIIALIVVFVVICIMIVYQIFF
jgi:hypothetical protein